MLGLLLGSGDCFHGEAVPQRPGSHTAADRGVLPGAPPEQRDIQHIHARVFLTS